MFHKKTISVLMAAAMLLGLTACGGTDTTATNADSSTTVSRSVSSESSQASESTETIVAKRSIMVEALTGDVTVTSDGNTVSPAKGELLESGQEVATKEQSDLTLLLDSDKHVYAEELTRFGLLAEGGPKSTKTVLSLMEGTLRSVIDNKLEPGESYEVTTPNASMAVRGTDFTVTVAQENGSYVTTVKVDDGIVEVKTSAGGEETTESLAPGEGVKITEAGLQELKEKSKSKVTKKLCDLYYNSGEKVYSYGSIYTYDENGYLIKDEYVNDKGTEYWYEYENDSNGLPLKESLCYPDGSGEYTKYEYDANGNKIHALTFIDIGSDTQVEYEYAYSYDSKGNLIEESCLLDEIEYDTYRITYAYDENGNKVKADAEFDYGEAYTEVWKYDSDGRLISYVQTSKPDNTVSVEWSGIEHDSDGNISEYLYSLMGEIRYRYLLSYDDKGNLLNETVIDVATGGVYSETKYEYAEDGE